MTSAATEGDRSVVQPLNRTFRLSHRSRTLLAASLGITLLLLVDGVISMRSRFREGQVTLTERADLLTATQAQALAVPLWDFDRAQTESVLAAFANDPDFQSVRVRDAAGKVIKESSAAGSFGYAPVLARHDITYLVGKNKRVIGSLELELSTNRLAAALASEIRYRVLTLLVLVGAVLLAVFAAFRQVTKPIDQMAKVTTRLANGDLAVSVPSLHRWDEVGDMARAIQVFKRNAVALTRAEEKYRAIYENAPVGIYRLDPDGRLLAANPALVRITGHQDETSLIAAASLSGTPDLHWYAEPGRREEFWQLIRNEGVVTGFTFQVLRSDGSVAWVSESARTVWDEVGAVQCYEGTVEDITERKRLAEDERLRVRAAVESASDAMVIVDAGGEPVYVNRAFRHLLGYEAEELAAIGGPAMLFDDVVLGREMQSGLKDHHRWDREARLIARSGQPIPMAIRASVIPATTGSVVGQVFILSDISARKQAEERMRHMAEHDALTGLPNRVLLRKHLAAATAQAEREGGAVSVLWLDLDRFKQVNDTLGHAAGDTLLQAVTERLRESVSDGDMVARLGGDEFVVVQQSEAVDLDATTALCRRLIEALSTPFSLDGHDVVIGTSIGVALFPVDGEEPDRLLQRADLALYQAKNDGRGTHCFFVTEMDVRLQERMVLERELRQAVAKGQLELQYQPQVDMATNRITGAEALLRWRHPEKGLISPADFIPLAEETGLIVGMGTWVIEAACLEAMTWPDPLRVAVNLSPVQFRQDDLAASVQAILEKTGFAAGRLELEITEGVLLEDTDATLTTLRALKALGVRIAMDDFGTGYSSLSYLRRFPFDKIKIDQSFVRDLGREDNATAIVRAIVALGGGLGMCANAEGVETAAQAKLLYAEGCAEVQGYHFGRPTPPREFAELVSRWPGQPESILAVPA